MSKYTGYSEAHKKAYEKYMNKKVMVTVRMTEEQREMLTQKAAAEGKSVNQYVLDKCL
ncbi:DUF1778 domain-containing protein [uncultured Eubacterium sp.]|uniref:plasmid mobilization protein n=1 Tax=uncultured Eubacterium sp. TaxID=165185 RepID=UPI0026725E89|nr:DUF1778 domain-containing protein [uncultured Eubacterium sp.]